MGKSIKTGNQAVVGIHSTSASKPTTNTIAKSATVQSSGSSSSGSRSIGKTNSSGTGSTAITTTESYTPALSEQLYSTYANGVGNGTGFDATKAVRTTRSVVNQAKSNLPAANVEKLSYVDISEQKKQLEDLSESQKQQILNQIDYATQQGVTGLQRAYEDALPQYQTQRDQIAIDEARALDNQALYASQRGDNGGIGQAQYGAIQNSAATNRQTVNSAQVKLYTDTNRQVADLQAQGEYDKADKVLSISQDYTEKLMDLEKWAQEKNIGIDEFNSKLDQWKAEYDLSVSKYLTDTELNTAKVTGAFSTGTVTADQYNDTADRYASSGKAMLSAGIIPSDEQLSAMGWTPEQYFVYRMSNAAGNF